MLQTMHGTCAQAATRDEAKFRIDGQTRIPRSIRVISLDRAASHLVQPTRHIRHTVRFLEAREAESADQPTSPPLLRPDGTVTQLDDELDNADFVLMVATAKASGYAAAAIGNACALQGIMTAAIIVETHSDAADAIFAVRPYARVLLVSHDSGDIAEIISVVGG